MFDLMVQMSPSVCLWRSVRMIDRERRRRRGQGGSSLPARRGHRYEGESQLQIESDWSSSLKVCVCVFSVICLRGRMEKERKLPPSATGDLLAGELLANPGSTWDGPSLVSLGSGAALVEHECVAFVPSEWRCVLRRASPWA